jgi:DNA polymerase III delta prime subunit
MVNFSHYLPQRMFLSQGDDVVAEALVADLAANDPFIQFLSVPRFTIDHARTVAQFAVEGDGTERTFVVYFAVFSSEAAQVLLKSLEEPASNTTIIFVTRYPYLVPQTVRSRLMIISLDIENHDTRQVKVILAQIQKEAAEKEDDAATRKGRAMVLLDELEAAIRDKKQYAETIYNAKDMLLKANLPTKYILDYISTVIRA